VIKARIRRRSSQGMGASWSLIGWAFLAARARWRQASVHVR
jgi:hypothetical protein